MHDIKFIRENPEAFDAGLARRGLEPMSQQILANDANARAMQNKLDNLLAHRNAMSKLIGQHLRDGDTQAADLAKAEIEGLKTEIPEQEDKKRKVDEVVSAILATLPNLPAAEVPEGADEEGNVEQKRWGDPRSAEGARDHVDIGAALGLDFETAQKVAGARFVYLRGAVARLNRALGQFMLDSHTGKFGYQEVSTPILVRSEAMFGTTQLPKFAEDSFQTTDGRWLISTSEISLTNQVREAILAEAELPLRFTALTPCFRSEAGAAGKDTRGLIRQHQFDKVELVSITTPEMSQAEHERMTSAAEAILEALGLPYRRMLLCSGDMGFAAEKTYDLEVWLPGQAKYREISSCSNCGAFQARRMAARYRPEGEKGTRFVHTLNGSGLAVGRTLVAVLENYQNKDGSVTIPPALVGHMGGIEVLEPAR